MMETNRTRHSTRFLFGLLWVAAVATLGCRPPEPIGEYNVILISIDTLRADRLGTYGYDRNTSPNIDQWAESALVFDAAVAESSWTLPSHVTMLSGLLPGNHSTVYPTLRPGDSIELLPELFSDARYRTIGLTDGGYLVRDHGFERGFEVFRSKQSTFDITLRRAVAEIEKLDQDERFFLFLHTYDVHCPYDPAESYREMFVSPESEFIETDKRCGNPDFNNQSLTEGQLRYLSDSYDASIRELDDHFGRFIEHLKSQGILERTVLILTSDHGEEFGEHGQVGHERTLFRESLMVPLVVSAPGLSPGRVRDLVGLVNIAPTALELAEVDTRTTFDGPSLVAIAAGRGAPAVQSRISELSWQGRMRSVMTHDWHLILDLETRQPSLYSVSSDPRESEDLAVEESKTVAELMEELRRYQSTMSPQSADSIGPQDLEQLERLRNLGYIN